MASGTPPATALAKNAVTLSRCQAARSSRTTMPILVSKRMRSGWWITPYAVLNAGAAPDPGETRENGPVADDWSRYWRSAEQPLEAMYAHFERHVYHRHSHETYSFGVTDSGAQTFTCRGGAHTSAAGMVMAFNPDDPHDGHAADELGFTYRMIHIGPELVTGVLADMAERRVGRP